MSSEPVKVTSVLTRKAPFTEPPEGAVVLRSSDGDNETHLTLDEAALDYAALSWIGWF